MGDQVNIIMTTWLPNDWRGDRKHEHAIDTVISWRKNLVYDGELVILVEDDGSDEGRYNRFLDELDLVISETLGVGSINNWQGERFDGRAGVGASLNRGFKHNGDVFLYLVDDWAVNEELDLTPWVELLRSEQSVGMVRLGVPHPNTRGQVKMYLQGWGLELDRYAFAFGFRPALIHRRMIEAYGSFAEGESSLECERLYNERFAQVNGPSIVLALPHPFYHTADDVHVSEEKPGVDDSTPDNLSTNI